MSRQRVSHARNSLSAGIAIVVCVLLAACGGVPTSGSVEAGDEVNDDVELGRASCRERVLPTV